ncbi:MAG: 5-(carboxyamino)imidazole ribonucleotide synthase [Akkermansiaceae bacterium]|nr:5-(carboxyamino)imidazole ribonucleotide synthase [Akkermansiaceae bacterium]
MSKLDGEVIGVIGGGQLGRMLLMQARQMNLRSVVWTGGHEAPASELADSVIDKPFDDFEATIDFCQAATVATVEFENIPFNTLEGVAQRIELHPSPQAVRICQNREREKNFLKEHEIPCADFELVTNADELVAAMERIGPGMLKTADFGYDGSGQIRVKGGEDAAELWRQFDAPRGVYEQWISYEREVSVMVARGANGETACYPLAENRHREQILDLTLVPAQVDEAVARKATELAVRIAEAMDYRGIMGVECFLMADGELLVNEMAPRPHNSGHYTMEACIHSQFDQQLRAVMGLPLGSTRLLSPVVMLNLLGDLWPDEATAPDWRPLFEDGQATLHLYGKAKASSRRKMGHANFLGETVDDAEQRALKLKELWMAAGQG